MAHHRLGEVCLSLGLMRSEDVDAVLGRMRDGGTRARFGELAMDLGLLDHDALAKALATQFRLNMVPRERLARLSVAAEVLDLLPRGLIQERLLVPTFLDEEKRVLSLLTADPTDIPSLRAAQTAARAARLRLFVAPRDAMRALVERLLPEGGEEPQAPPLDATRPAAEPPRPVTVVFEPDGERAAVLRRLGIVEGGGAEVVGDPEQVSSFIEANQADRVFFRRAAALDVEPYLPAWRRIRPMLQVCVVEGWGPALRSGVPYEAARDFFLALLSEHLLGVALDDEGAPADGPETSTRILRTVRLARALAEELRMPPAHRDTVTIAALYVDLEELSGRDVAEDLRLARAAERLGRLSPPFPVVELLAALGQRSRGEVGPGAHPGAEVLFTARAAAWLSPHATSDPVQALGVDAARHDAATLRALTTVVRRRASRNGSWPTGLEQIEPTFRPASLASFRVNPPAPARPPSLAGQLVDLSLPDVLQTLQRARKTVVVKVFAEEELGCVQVRDGRLAAARMGTHEGDEAFYALVCVEVGRFEVRPEDEGKTNLNAPGEFLLLEALRRRDEHRAAAGPSGEAR